MPFVKLDCQALDSTLWVLRPDREVFLTALLMAEPFELLEDTPALNVEDLKESGFVVPKGWYGFVAASGPGIVRRAIVSELEGKEALKRLAEPEAESRSHDFEGRRMVRIDGGYIILNFQKFRERDYSAAERMKRYRERKKNDALRVTGITLRVTGRSVTQVEGEAEGQVEEPKPKEAVLPFSSDAFKEAWGQWTKHRSEIRKPLKPTSTKMCLKELSAMGETRAIAAIEFTIAKGWQGLREPEAHGDKKHGGSQDKHRAGWLA